MLNLNRLKIALGLNLVLETVLSTLGILFVGGLATAVMIYLGCHVLAVWVGAPWFIALYFTFIICVLVCLTLFVIGMGLSLFGLSERKSVFEEYKECQEWYETMKRCGYSYNGLPKELEKYYNVK